MFAVIFEVHPRADRFDEYLGLAKLLKPELETVEGFIENERFASRRRAGWVLSLSTWRDEKSLIRWRTHALHHSVQEKGRGEVFEDYRLRVGEIVADSRLPPGQELRRERFDETEAGDAKLLTITERPLAGEPAEGRNDAAALPGLVEWDVFDSLYRPDKLLLLNAWRDGAAAAAWNPAAARDVRHRSVRIIRDYGMFARHEAPQYYPPVARPRR